MHAMVDAALIALRQGMINFDVEQEVIDWVMRDVEVATSSTEMSWTVFWNAMMEALQQYDVMEETIECIEEDVTEAWKKASS